jgi:cellulose synthase/poly-beta-1,6-N-acetylglucosamine synthase-like glycosyltransferase
MEARSGGPHAEPANDKKRRACPELDCLRHHLPEAVLAAAERRAQAVGTGADRVLIASGQIDEETYLRALGETLGIGFEPLDGIARTQCPIDDARLIESAATGLLPLAAGDALGDAPPAIVIAPRGIAAHNIVRLIEQDPAAARRFRFTSAERFNCFVMRYAGNTIAARASDALQQTWPLMSAVSSNRLKHLATLASIAVLSLAGFVFAPATTVLTFQIMLAAVFLAWLVLRLTGAFIGRPKPKPAIEPPDDALPVYTIIAALYREAASVNGLLAAIDRFDYPPEKLDVILAIEADDCDTRAAIAAARPRLPITVIPVPAQGPRTKPKALNVALPFARGSFTVVYDAEDRPETQQLRCALQAFRAGSSDLACVQARLCIDNTADSWLARFYTAEYAGQFDVFLPGLAALRLPLPLGGSSNHFHTETLREVGAWDAYNVTEDADLGIRLARFGYRADIIASTTYEEAPAHIGPWIRQRTRWFKGWIQTWFVHMRQPRHLLRKLGLPGFLAFQLMVGGSALAALVHPLFVAGLIYSIASGDEIWRGDNAAVAILGALYGTTAIIGYLSSAFLGWLGLIRRGLPGAAWVLILTPLHWLLLSFAAWRAVYQFAVAPYAWEKTAHGLAKTSHRATKMTRALIDLERELRDLKDSGRLPVIGDAAPDWLARRGRRRSHMAA